MEAGFKFPLLLETFPIQSLMQFKIKKRNMFLEEFSDKYHVKQRFNNAHCTAGTMVALDKVKYKAVCLATQ